MPRGKYVRKTKVVDPLKMIESAKKKVNDKLIMVNNVKTVASVNGGIDLRNVAVVEVLIQKKPLAGGADPTDGEYTVWVNTEDGCKFRATNVKYILLNDLRDEVE